jgi:hypothetical protein
LICLIGFLPKRQVLFVGIMKGISLGDKMSFLQTGLQHGRARLLWEMFQHINQ